MQAPTFFSQNKKLVIEVALAAAVLLGGYYVMSLVTAEDTLLTTEEAVNEQLLGQNLVIFLQAVSQDKINLSNTSFMESPLVKSMQDFSETIGENPTRGRSEPFLPYATSRPLR